MQDVVEVELTAPVVPEDRKLTGVLRPAGYRVLVQILPPEEAQREWKKAKAAGIQVPPDVRDREWAAQVWAEVIELGPDAYKDEKRYPSGPWCKVGDAVVIRPYVGTRFSVGDHMYALINDDTVQGVTSPEQAEEIERV